jgi:hypothetical protein
MDVGPGMCSHDLDGTGKRERLAHLSLGQLPASASVNPERLSDWQRQEDMEPVTQEEERQRLVFAVRNKSFDRELGQYPDEANRGWARISYLITPATL